MQKEGREYLPQEAPSRACKTNCVKQRTKETQLPRMAPLIRGTLPHVNKVTGNCKLRKDKIADPVIRQLNVTLWLFKKGKKEETFEIYFVSSFNLIETTARNTQRQAAKDGPKVLLQWYRLHRHMDVK